MASKLDKVRALMGSYPSKQPSGGASQQGIDAFIVRTVDPHMTEYFCEHDKRLRFITDFTGSNGTAAITKDKALLWTDGRYFLQADMQLSKDWTLMKQGEPDVPSLENWIESNMAPRSRIGVDPYLISLSEWRRYESLWDKKEISIVPVEYNLVDHIWEDQPPRPLEPLIVFPDEIAGASSRSKIDELRKMAKDEGAEHIIVSALDDVMWLLNIRGGDVPYTPVSYAYLIVCPDKVQLFIEESKVSAEVRKHLGNVEILPYGAVTAEVEKHTKADPDSKFLVDPNQCNYALSKFIPKSSMIETAHPITARKAVKNEREIQGLRQANIYDGVALVSLFQWLEESLAKGEKIMETDVSKKAVEFRSKQPGFICPSFASISGAGPNGAIIHYEPEVGKDRQVTTKEVYLLDSGGQYLEGTTDITRTMHFGSPSEWERECFTRVLQGHIALAKAIFPEGSTGYTLDLLARHSLWKKGLDYKHGTGHAVGQCLLVHEPPMGIWIKAHPSMTTPYKAGFTATDEPGYYEAGAFGIRIESLLVCVEAFKSRKMDDKQFLTFDYVTYVPIQKKMLHLPIMSEEEIKWVDDYHKLVRKTLEPLVKEQPKVLEFLTRETEPIERS